MSAPNDSAGTPQAIVLISAPLFAMLGAVLIAPLLATIQASFRGAPHAEVLVPMLLTAPALFLAVLSPFAGILAERVGARRMLLWSFAGYGVAGTAPLYLQSLYLIFISRLLVGVAEAGLVTSAMTLLSSYFLGDQRQKWFAYQTAWLTWVGAAIIAVTGALGNLNWRLTFAMYGLAFLVWIIAAYVLFDPPGARESGESIATVDSAVAARFNLRQLPWRPLLRVAAIAVPGSIAFYLAPTEVSYLLAGLGITEPSVGANITAGGLLVGPVGALLSRRLTEFSVGKVLAFAMTVMGAGLIVMAIGRTVPMIAAGLVIQQTGGGLMFVTAMTYVLSLANTGERGLYSGVWWFFYMIAQFVTPLVISALLQLTGARVPSVIVAGLLIACTSIWLLLSNALRRAVVPPDVPAFGR